MKNAKSIGIVELFEQKMKVTPLTPEQKAARAKRKAQEQQPQQGQVQQGQQAAQPQADDKPEQKQSQQAETNVPQTEVGKAIVMFAKEHPQLVAQIMNRINRIGISESVDGESLMITEIFGLGKPKTGMKYDEVISKWDAAGNPRDAEGIKKFLAGLGIKDESISVILSNAGYEDSTEADNKKTMKQYEELQKQLRILRKRDKATFVKEVKSILAILNQIGSTQ